MVVGIEDCRGASGFSVRNSKTGPVGVMNVSLTIPNSKREI